MKLISRSALIGAGSAIALVGLPLMTRFVEAAQAADPDDLATLNAAIQLELAAIKAYADAAKTGLVSPPVLKVVSGFVADHTAHAQALTAAVKAGGGIPATAPATLTYPGLKSEADILRFALTLEEKAATTYLSVIPDLKDRTLAQVAGSILGVETTHVAKLAEVLGQHPYPNGFVA